MVAGGRAALAALPGKGRAVPLAPGRWVRL